MIYLHTHLLLDWDDGAKNWDEVKRICEITTQDGIKTIALTLQGNDLKVLVRKG